MITGATLLIGVEIFKIVALAIIFVELRRNHTAIRQTQVMINLFMEELVRITAAITKEGDPK